MPWISTLSISPTMSEFTPSEVLQLYNGLDTALTLEIFQKLQQTHNTFPEVYSFSRALQAPVLEMMLRGWKIDLEKRDEVVEELRARLLRLENILNIFADAVWSKPLNANSPKQLIDFFYRTMKLPEQWISKKGESRLSTDREALEKLLDYFDAKPIINTILAIRDLKKQLSVLTTEIDFDNRFRSSFNIAGTETARFSSSSSAWGTGSNIQNISPSLRFVFSADWGKKIVGIDLEQAESREVGWLCGILFNDWSYLDACYAGDLHTLTCRLIWSDLPWTGDLKKDRAIADNPFYREYSYRDMSKRGGHGSNYFGTPLTMARHLKVPTKIMEHFQEKYFSAFPGIPKYHKHVAKELQTVQRITTPWGRTRTFFGRPNDPSTLREAIAFSPQSSTADRMNLGLYRLWEHFGKRIQLLAQVHDAVYFQIDENDNENEIITKALEIIDIPLFHGTRKLIVPGEAKSGWNWGNWCCGLRNNGICSTSQKPCALRANPNGLKKFKNQDLRKRDISSIF